MLICDVWNVWKKVNSNSDRSPQNPKPIHTKDDYYNGLEWAFTLHATDPAISGIFYFFIFSGSIRQWRLELVYIASANKLHLV